MCWVGHHSTGSTTAELLFCHYILHWSAFSAEKCWRCITSRESHAVCLHVASNCLPLSLPMPSIRERSQRCLQKAQSSPFNRKNGLLQTKFLGDHWCRKYCSEWQKTKIHMREKHFQRHCCYGKGSWDRSAHCFHNSSANLLTLLRQVTNCLSALRERKQQSCVFLA